MVVLLSISRHSPENCPFYSEKFTKLGNEMMEEYGSLDKMEEEWEKIAEKHCVKKIGTWFVPSEHLIFGVTEAPSIEAYQEFLTELRSPIFEVSTTEIKIAFSSKEAMKIMVPSENKLSESEKHILQKIIEYFL